MEHKIIFEKFESSWFEVFNGVKQGCILSPTLFSVVMLDLIDMLNEKQYGILYGNERVPCLLYADDITLIAENEQQFICMLQVAHSFVVKWNMSFNVDKSKVMVIGKRIDKTKKWMLGTLQIS